MKEALGLTDEQLIFKWNIPENEACYDAAVDLAEQGCDIIFANSFGFEDYVLQAAEEYPNIQFLSLIHILCQSLSTRRLWETE